MAARVKSATPQALPKPQISFDEKKNAEILQILTNERMAETDMYELSGPAIAELFKPMALRLEVIKWQADQLKKMAIKKVEFLGNCKGGNVEQTEKLLASFCPPSATEQQRLILQFNFITDTVYNGGPMKIVGVNNSRWPTGTSCLHMAAFFGRDALMEMILKKLASAPGCSDKFKLFVDLQDDEGETALHCAVGKGSIACAKLLCDIGKAGLEIKSYKNGGTPMMKATAFRHEEAIAYLLEKGANKDEKDFNGETAEAWK